MQFNVQQVLGTLNEVNSPLLSAARGNHERMVTFLLASNADAEHQIGGKIAFELTTSPTIKLAVLDKQVENFLKSDDLLPAEEKSAQQLLRYLRKAENASSEKITMPAVPSAALQTLYNRIQSLEPPSFAPKVDVTPRNAP